MAAPNPERELDRLETLFGRVPKAGPLPSLVITGPSDFFRTEAVELALARLPEELERRHIDGEMERESDGGELLDLRGGNLFGRGTVLVVRRGDSWLKRHAAGLAATLDGIAPTCCLLLEVQKLDKRTKLFRKLGEVGEVFEFRDLYREPYDRRRSPLEAELVGWVVERAGRLGCPLTPESAYLLVGSVGTAPGELLRELLRLKETHAPGDGKPSRALTPDDLRGRLTCSFESTPFELAEAFLANDRRGALRALSAMFERGTRSKDGGALDAGALFPFITSWLYQSLAQVREGRLLSEGGTPLAEIPKRLGVRVFVERFLAQVEQNPLPRLARGIRLLLQCQRELRTTGEEPRLLLERFLSRYFAAAASAGQP